MSSGNRIVVRSCSLTFKSEVKKFEQCFCTQGLGAPLKALVDFLTTEVCANLRSDYSVAYNRFIKPLKEDLPPIR